MTRKRTTNLRVLVVEDDKHIRESIVNLIGPTLVAIQAATAAGAARALTRPTPIAAAVVDVGLPDGSGIDVAVQIREKNPRIPILILTGRAEPELINRAHALRAEYVCKPDFEANLLDFARRIAGRPANDEALLDLAATYAKDTELSVRQAQIVSLSVSGVPRSHLAEALGVSENTIKTQVKFILEKTREKSLADVIWRIRSRA